jgi:hypothetical protein
MKRISIMLMFICAIAVQAVYADVPRTINYQGRLTDTVGMPVADGIYSVAIRMYDAVDALESASVWSDTYSVQTKNGYFNVVLGSNPSFPLNNSFSKPYWIGLKVGTDAEMIPRQALQSTPYALNAIFPIGTILPWHKNIVSPALTLPDGFVECNGQTLSDANSPINGATIPNLNGDGRFLRGASTSGPEQEDAFQGHYHEQKIDTNGYEKLDARDTDAATFGGYRAAAGGTKLHDVVIGDAMIDGTNGTPRTANETRPKNMSVVWIIKVK